MYLLAILRWVLGLLAGTIRSSFGPVRDLRGAVADRPSRRASLAHAHRGVPHDWISMDRCFEREFSSGRTFAARSFRKTKPSSRRPGPDCPATGRHAAELCPALVPTESLADPAPEIRVASRSAIAQVALDATRRAAAASLSESTAPVCTSMRSAAAVGRSLVGSDPDAGTRGNQP